MNLSELKNGESGIIAKVRGRGAIRKRILEMGFVKGKEVKVIKNAPLRDPIEYKIMDYNISLRRSEAIMIDVVTTPLKAVKAGKNINRVIVTDKLIKKADRKGKEINVALVGNPNSGKTTLFNYISGSREHVGNYAGVTVDVKKSRFTLNGYTFNISDMPGTYSLTAYSPEEVYVRNHILETLPDIVINVIDASNLERNLYLTTQLIDMDIKVIAALNIYDELEQKGDRFDYESLGRMIGIPFIPTVSSKGKGIQDLFIKAIETYEDREDNSRHIHINYGDDIEKSVREIQNRINIPENLSLTDIISSRFMAIKLLEKDHAMEKKILEKTGNGLDILLAAKNETINLEEHLKEDSETLISNAKYGFINGALMETYAPAKRPKVTLSEKIDSIITSRITGFPIFLIFMWLTFQVTFSIGEYPKKLIESFMGLITDFAAHSMGDGLLKDLFIDGILSGVSGVIVFLPNIMILFFMISLMEDTGYMARASFIMDKLMHFMGLHGKSFIPLVMGFGCNAPAIMATRTLENRNDRMITMLILPFISCSARLPVYILIIGAFFQSNPGTMLFAIYLIGIAFAIITALALKGIVFKSRDIPFVMELPPYRWPHVKTTSKHMWDKAVHYLKRIAAVVLTASIIIWTLGKFPLKTDYSRDYEKETAAVESVYDVKIKTASAKDDVKKKLEIQKDESIKEIKLAMESERLEKSYIGRIGKSMEPVLFPLGFDWKIGVSLLTGFMAKEIVVSTMSVLFAAERGDENLAEKLKTHSFNTGPKKGEMVFTGTTAFAFMIFVLLYVPCMATIATIGRESGKWRWALFSIIYSTALAWIVSFAVVRIGALL